jgi:hypothetical protein
LVDFKNIILLFSTCAILYLNCKCFCWSFDNNGGLIWWFGSFDGNGEGKLGFSLVLTTVTMMYLGVHLILESHRNSWIWGLKFEKILIYMIFRECFPRFFTFSSFASNNVLLCFYSTVFHMPIYLFQFSPFLTPCLNLDVVYQLVYLLCLICC